jgi:hypothetical protein
MAKMEAELSRAKRKLARSTIFEVQNKENGNRTMMMMHSVPNTPMAAKTPRNEIREDI